MEQLFTEFESVDAAKWQQQLEKDLKGITFDQLSKTDANHFTIHPFYTHDDLEKLPKSDSVFQHSNWDIVQYILVTSEKESNATVLQLLNDGVSGLFLEVAEDVDLFTLLQDVQLPFITTVFKVNGNVVLFQEKLHFFLAEKNYSSNNNIFILDNNALTADRQLTIDGSAFNNRGANSTTELAAIIGLLQDQLQERSDAATLTTIDKIYIQVAVDTLFYEQIAKLRALRILCYNVCKAYHHFPAVYVHVVTSHVYRSHVDMHSNMLRDTLAAMSGVLGGANGLTIFSYDYYVQASSSFSHRMSKNIQLLLREEAYLHLIGDVSSGSYYLEQLTHQLVAAAWQKFLHWEATGGMASNTALLEKEIEEQGQALISAYQQGKKILIGVNKHKNNMEQNTPVFNAPNVTIPNNYINIAQALF